MSVASQWKLKEKQAAAASAAISKTGIPAARGNTEASAKDVSGGGTVSGPMGFKGHVEKSGKLETFKPGPPEVSKPGPPQASKPGPPQATSFGKQGVSKLPVGKDTLKSSQTREADAVPTRDGAVQSLGATPSSKIPVGAKENIASVGGRKPFGWGMKKEEPAPAIRSKAEDNKAKTTELTKEPAGGAKDSAAAAAAVAAGDDGPLGPGRTKGLAGFWANQNDEVKTVKKKRLTAVEENLAPMVVENTPQQLEGVVRAQDPGEWKKPLQVEDGWTKNVVSSFQKRQQESFSKRTPISLVENTSNEESDIALDAEAAKVKVKDISQRLSRQQSEPTKQVKEKLVIDRSQGAIVLAENQPMEVDPDVVRSEDASKEEVVLEKGRTRNLLQLWKNTEVEYNTPKTSTHRYQGSKPTWILEIEAAKGNPAENNDEGQPEDNNTIEMNDEDESGKSVTNYMKIDSASEASKHTDDSKHNIVLDKKVCLSHPEEFDKAVLPLPKGNTDVETIQSLKPITHESSIIKLEGNDGTIGKEIPCAETPTTVDAVSQGKVAEWLPDLVPSKIENTMPTLTAQLAEEIPTEEGRVAQSVEAPLGETNRKYDVCKPVNENESLDGTTLLEEAKQNAEVVDDAPSFSPGQNKTLQERSEAEKEVQKLLPKESSPIDTACERDGQQSELASTQQNMLLSESSRTTLDREEPIEQNNEGARSLSSAEIKANEYAGVFRSDAALNLPDAECIAGRSNRSENEMTLGRIEVAVSTTSGVGPIQIHDVISGGERNIRNDTLSKLSDDYASNVSSIQNNMVTMPQRFLGPIGESEVAFKGAADEAVKIQAQTNPVCDENKGAMVTEDREESSDNETFLTPTKSVILTPLAASVVSAKQVETRDLETREWAENVIDKIEKESRFNEGTLIDLQTESIETKREKLSLFSLDDLLQFETSSAVDNSSADKTPCLVPLSSPSTPEENISSQSSSGVFDSDSEKGNIWFSPQEETTLSTAKTETISTHAEIGSLSGSLDRKTSDGNGPKTESTDEQTNKTEASQVKSIRLWDGI